MKHIDVAIAIIHRSSQVLICQRHTNGSFANLWEFPGGKIESDESPEQCVEREIQEELGIQVKAAAPFPVIEHTYPETAIRLFPFLCPFGEGDPRPLAARCLEWVEAPRLRDYPFPAANDVLIDQIIARLGRQ